MAGVRGLAARFEANPQAAPKPKSEAGPVKSAKELKEEKKLALLRKKKEQQEKDDWFYQNDSSPVAVPRGPPKDDEEEEDFKMLTAADFAQPAPVVQSNKKFAVKNLIDFDECDVADEGDATLEQPPVTFHTPPAAFPPQQNFPQQLNPGPPMPHLDPVVTAHVADDSGEAELLRMMLKQKDSEMQIQLDIMRDEVEANAAHAKVVEAQIQAKTQECVQLSARVKQLEFEERGLRNSAHELQALRQRVQELEEAARTSSIEGAADSLPEAESLQTRIRALEETTAQQAEELQSSRQRSQELEARASELEAAASQGTASLEQVAALQAHVAELHAAGSRQAELLRAREEELQSSRQRSQEQEQAGTSQGSIRTRDGTAVSDLEAKNEELRSGALRLAEALKAREDELAQLKRRVAEKPVHDVESLQRHITELQGEVSQGRAAIKQVMALQRRVAELELKVSEQARQLREREAVAAVYAGQSPADRAVRTPQVRRTTGTPTSGGELFTPDEVRTPAAASELRPSSPARPSGGGNPNAEDPWDAWFGVEDHDKGQEDDMPAEPAPAAKPASIQQRPRQPRMRNLLEMDSSPQASHSVHLASTSRSFGSPTIRPHEPEARPSGGSGIALPIQNDIVGQITEDGRLAAEKVKAQFASASRSMGQAADKFRMAWSSFSALATPAQPGR
jgi:hypothetical protein